jgi:hypothetical protein
MLNPKGYWGECNGKKATKPFDKNTIKGSQTENCCF